MTACAISSTYLKRYTIDTTSGPARAMYALLKQITLVGECIPLFIP